MKREYENFIRNVTYLNNWKTAPQLEKEGAIGAALVFAYTRGTEPTLEDLAAEIEVHPNMAYEPFTRLLVNGIFSNHYDARNDPALNASAKDVVIYDENNKERVLFKASRVTECAWQIISGIASGYTGLRENNKR